MRKKTNTKADLGKLSGLTGNVVLALFLISGVVNVLALTGSFYMLQIYDRALTSRSMETLVALSMLAIGLYVFQGLLDIIRSQVLLRIGTRIDDRLAPLAHRVAIDMPRAGYAPSEAIERSRDVDVLRQFISGQGPVALLDLPWMPIYLAFVYVLHPSLALLVGAAAVLLGSLTLVTELLTRRHGRNAQRDGLARAMLTDAHVRNAEALRAMGFVGRAVQRFETANRAYLASQMRATDVGGSLAGLSKVLRMIMQSAVLGVGAYLVIKGEMSAGAIIAASVASARALAPIDLVIGQWKSLSAARRAYKRLGETIAALDDGETRVQLPAPKRNLKVEKITVAAPGTGTVVLSDVAFELKAGQALGLVGPSGSGKSSLARVLTGVWPTLRGNVRLDDAALVQWRPDDIGQHIGYLPQEVSLLDGTVAENISRFDTELDGREIIEAAQLAGVHEMILRLPMGYETAIGSGGSALSAGQRQRIALARALYRRPFLVVLDEPNSNLDAEGDAALTRAIRQLREAGSITIVIAHRQSALSAVDLIGVMQAGRMIDFGSKNDIVARQMKPAARSANVVNGPPVVNGPIATGDAGAGKWASSKS